MEFDVKFSSTEQNFDAQLVASDQSFCAEFGTLHTVIQPGATFIPSVSSDGVLSWTNDQGLENPAPVNVRGPAGAEGKTPVKGTDYFTETDKAEIVEAVIAELPIYSGEYEIIPLVSSDIEMLTGKKYMDANVKIRKIPYAETSNNTGGITVTIGG